MPYDQAPQIDEAPKSMIRHLAFTVLPFSIALSAISSNCYAEQAKVGDKMVMVSEADRDMNAAIAKARVGLDDFLKLAAKPPVGASDFKLKVMISDSHGSEHFWVIPFEHKAGKFSGIIANDPEIVTSVNIGQNYAFSKDQISDWGYQKDGKQVGSYTVCVMFKTMPKELVERYRKDYGFECKE